MTDEKLKERMAQIEKDMDVNHIVVVPSNDSPLLFRTAFEEVLRRRNTSVKQLIDGGKVWVCFVGKGYAGRLEDNRSRKTWEEQYGFKEDGQ